jgi:hypothetical protein
LISQLGIPPLVMKREFIRRPAAMKAIRDSDFIQQEFPWMGKPGALSAMISNRPVAGRGRR